MKRTRTIAAAVALFWIALGALICYVATRLGLGSVTEPGSGFIFFWSGLILALLSLVALAESMRGSGEGIPETAETNWPKIGLILLSLLFYAFLLERLGFIVTTFILLSFLLALNRATNWFRALGVASAAVLASFALFELWLKIRLPKGILGF